MIESMSLRVPVQGLLLEERRKSSNQRKQVECMPRCKRMPMLTSLDSPASNHEFDSTFEPSVLAKRYFLFLGAMSAIAILGMLLVHYITRHSQSDTRLVNIAGRQRMLSQAIAKDALLVARASDVSDRRRVADDLRSVVALWELSQFALEHGDPALGVPVPTDDQVRQTLATPDRHFGAMLDAAHALVKQVSVEKTPTDVSREVDSILVHQGPYLQAVNDRVFEYDRAAAHRARTENQLQLGLLLSILSALLLQGLVVLRPALGRIQHGISQRERFEQTLQEKNVELENASLAKDRFLASMSHELRTPLNAVIGFTGTLLMKLPGPLNTEQEKQLRTIQTSSRHLLSLINDLLDLAKIESGNVELKMETVSCQSVMEEVSATLRTLAESKGLQFEVRLPGHEITVSTDRRSLTQILINLANNAIKFTEKGAVRLELAERRRDGHTTAEIRVVDSGVGIRKEDQSKLFQAFMQVDNSSTRAYEGTGLGLHVSQKLAAMIGGRISFESEYGQGSQFTLSLPLGRDGKLALMAQAGK